VPRWFIEFLPSPSERALVEEMLKGGSVPSAEVNLSASGQTIYELLNNRDPERVPELWVRLGPEIQQTLDGLSPHLKIDQLRTNVAIIHTLTDDVIPWVESRKLAEAIDDEQEVYFKVFGRFYHTDIKQLLNVRLSNLVGIVSEATQFYLYIYSILYQL